MKFKLKSVLLIACLLLLYSCNSGAQNKAANHLFWFSSQSPDLRNTFIQLLDSSTYSGLDKNDYHYAELVKYSDDKADDATLQLRDSIYTLAAIHYFKDLYTGHDIDKWLRYDEWSKKNADKDDEFIRTKLSVATTPNALRQLSASLEPTTPEYLAYKSEYQKALAGYSNRAPQIAATLNFYRWYTHFNFDRYIVVNLPGANLRLYDNGNQALYSQLIVGKPKTPTPIFDATCHQVQLYPYWNVPPKIAVKEYAPKYRRNPALAERNNMQVLNASGHAVDPAVVNWASFAGSGYRLRQSTGCDNALGVIKFDITDPFDVYLHDTNAKGLFTSQDHHLSHGCMRVQQALELGDLLLNGNLDKGFLQACFKDQQPQPVKLDKPVPVFVIYSTIQYDNGEMKYYDDVYNKF